MQLILLVVHVKGQEYSVIKFVLNIFTDCELIFCYENPIVEEQMQCKGSKNPKIKPITEYDHCFLHVRNCISRNNNNFNCI